MPVILWEHNGASVDDLSPPPTACNSILLAIYKWTNLNDLALGSRVLKLLSTDMDVTSKCASLAGIAWLSDEKLITASNDDTARLFGLSANGTGGELQIALVDQNRASGAANNHQLHPRHRVYLQCMAASRNGVFIAYYEKYVASRHTGCDHGASKMRYRCFAVRR